MRHDHEPQPFPLRVVSISGELAPQEGSIEWTTANDKAFDVSHPPTGTMYTGRCVDKALVKTTMPSSDDKPERVIGTFPSRRIKIIR